MKFNNASLFAATALAFSLVACGGNSSSKSPEAPAPLENKAPVFKAVSLGGSLNPTKADILCPSTVQLIAKAEDPEFHGVTYSLQVPSWLSVKETGAGYWELTPQVLKGQDQGAVGRSGAITLMAQDPEGKSNTTTILVQVPNRHTSIPAGVLPKALGIGDSVRPGSTYFIPDQTQMANMVQDPEGSDLTFTWTAKNGQIATKDKDGKPMAHGLYTAPKEGSDSITLEVKDILGQTDTYVVEFKIAPNAAPVFEPITVQIPKTREENRDAAGVLNFLQEDSLKVRVKATDPEKDVVTLSAKSSNGLFEVCSETEKDEKGNGTGYLLYWLHPTKLTTGQTATLEITATDGFANGPQSTTCKVEFTWVARPEITKDLAPETVLAGTVALEVANTYGDESTYQWFRKVKGSDTPLKVEGAVFPIFTLKASQATDEVGNRYFCVIKVKDKGVYTSNTTKVIEPKA